MIHLTWKHDAVMQCDAWWKPDCQHITLKHYRESLQICGYSASLHYAKGATHVGYK